MPPPSSGGMAVIQMLNVLEGYDLKANGYGSAKNIHLTAEAMRRAFADRARYLGDPDFEKDIPLPMLISKDYAAQLAQDDQPRPGVEVVDQLVHVDRANRRRRRTSRSSTPSATPWRMTYTLEYGYGSTHRRARRRLPAEQRDGRLQRRPRPHRRARPDRHRPRTSRGPASACCRAWRRRSSPKDGQLFMVTGTPGGRTIINTVLTTILNVIDYGMNAQEAVDAGRMHHQWLPDRISLERFGFSADTIATLQGDGPHHQRGRRPGRGAGDRVQSERQHARRRRRSPPARRRRGRKIATARSRSPAAARRCRL